MKKLLIISVLLPAVQIIIIVAPSYYINYEVYVSLLDCLASFEWLTLLGILTGGALLSASVAFIKVKSLSYTPRFLRVNIFFNTAFLLFISYHAVSALLNAKRETDALLSEYKIKAESDIKNGLIIHETAGLPSWDYPLKVKQDKIDSLLRTYGIENRNIGCVVTASLMKAQSYYEELTTPYLDRRNGPGWRHRMETQIANIRKGLL